MRLRHEITHGALFLGFALCAASSCTAQARPQTRGGTEVASPNNPAQPAPYSSPSDATATAVLPPANHVEAPKSSVILDELDAMKKRIAELESELTAKNGEAKSKETEAASPSTTPKPDTVATPVPADFWSSSSENIADVDVSTSDPQAGSADPQGPAAANKKPEPFSLFDSSWMNANPRNEDTPLATKYFSPELRWDSNYTLDYRHPVDHSLGGSTETFRSGEVQVEQMSFGGDLRYGNVRGRILTMYGMFASTTPRDDASLGVGQWNLRAAYQYFSEAWAGYHFDVNYGLNVDAGIFASYIGLFSYYNYDNWAYQPSFVSSNTPWFFNGVRVQWFPTPKLKIEPWLVNGWQSYAKYNGYPGLGGQILWRPNAWFSLVLNNYGMGTDVLGNPHQSRIHTDDSVEVRYYNHPGGKLDYMAFTFTGDLGCQYGQGTTVASVTCFGGHHTIKESMVGAMAYNRWDFAKNHYGITVGGGFLNNPGRYLTLVPPINGADAVTGSPYFTENPGDPFHGVDGTITLDWMPSQFVTFRFEAGYRHSQEPYWSGHGGVTPPGFPGGGTNGEPTQYVCANGAASGITSSGSIPGDLPHVINSCASIMGVTNPKLINSTLVWFPDLVRDQFTNTIAIMVKF